MQDYLDKVNYAPCFVKTDIDILLSWSILPSEVQQPMFWNNICPFVPFQSPV